MKRTAEIILGIIGVLGFAFTAALGGLMIWLQNNRELLEEPLNEAGSQNTDLAAADFEMMIDMLGTGGWVLLTMSIAAIILGIVSMALLKGNKKPAAAGIIFIATAGIAAILTGGAGILAGIFYLAAGITALVRKPQRVVAEY